MRSLILQDSKCLHATLYLLLDSTGALSACMVVLRVAGVDCLRLYLVGNGCGVYGWSPPPSLEISVVCEVGGGRGGGVAGRCTRTFCKSVGACMQFCICFVTLYLLCDSVFALRLCI